MKSTLIILSALFSTTLFASPEERQYLKEFHKFGITHCDEFIVKNVHTPGSWVYFINKHQDGIDGPATEVSFTQISGKAGSALKTEFSFIQTLKKCFLHKRGQITIPLKCEQAVDKNQWQLQHDLDNFGYQKYQDKKGVTLFTTEKQIGNQSICLMDYQFRARGEHSLVYQ